MDEAGDTLDFLLWCAALVTLAFMDGVLLGYLLAAILGYG